MGTALKLTAKGQITLKKEFLQHLGVEIGSLLEVEKLPDGGLKISAHMAENRTSFADFAGIFPNPTGKTVTLEEINDCIAQSYAQAGMKGLEEP